MCLGERSEEGCGEAGVIYLNSHAAATGLTCKMLASGQLKQVHCTHLFKLKHNRPVGTIIAKSTKHIFL
jgi:hypothetical protein